MKLIDKIKLFFNRCPCGGHVSRDLTGGAKEITLSSSQSGLPAHNHTQNAHKHGFQVKDLAGAGTVYNELRSGSTGGGEWATHYVSDTTPTNNANIAANAASAHNNLQPYITCYMWKRTA